MAGKLGIEHSVIGFYAFNNTGGVAEALYRATLRWCDRLRCPPHIMGTSYDKKLISFKRSNSKLEKIGFSNVEYFQLVSLPPDAKHELEGDNFQIVADFKRQTLTISARTSIASLTKGSLLPLAQEAADILQPEYGIGFHRDERFGPTFYVSGVGCFPASWKPPESEEEEEKMWAEIGGWGSYGLPNHVWQHGFIRSVYPWNFLTSSQLQEKIDGLTLERWIRKSPDHGTLTGFTNNMTLWEVPTQDIPRLKTLLEEAKIIFNARRYDDIYYEARDGQSAPPEEILRRLRDPNYVIEPDPCPPPPLSAEGVLRMVLGDTAAEEVRVLHVDKQGTEPAVQELSTEEVKRIQKKGNKPK
jgi:hypothetical protein